MNFLVLIMSVHYMQCGFYTKNTYYVLFEHECQICLILFMCLFSFILGGVLLLFLANIKKYKFTLINYALIKLYLLLYLFPINKISCHEWGVSCVILLLLFMHLCWSTHTSSSLRPTTKELVKVWGIVYTFAKTKAHMGKKCPVM